MAPRRRFILVRRRFVPAWKTAAGHVLAMCDMSDSHLLHTLAMIARGDYAMRPVWEWSVPELEREKKKRRRPSARVRDARGQRLA